jgi:mannose-1-phosphate guanylyltransferase
MGDEPFFVLNSDITCNYPLREMLEFHKKSGAEGTILVTKVDDPSKYGVIVANKEGRIERFVEKPKVYVGNKINAGIYVFSPAILNRISLKPTSIEKEIFPQMAKDGQLYRMVLEGYWMDIGQPKDFITGSALYLHNLRQHRPEMLAKGDYVAASGRTVLVHPTAHIGKGCSFGPNVTVGPNVVIKDGVRLVHTIILDGSVIQDNAFISHSIIGWRCTVGKWARVENSSVIGEDVQIGDEIWINGAKVLPHKSIMETIPSPAVIM